MVKIRVEPRRDDHLAHLALVADVVADQEVLGHLLGDGRAALRPAGLGEIGDEGADQAALVDALVLIEALVFGRDERLLYIGRNFLERHPDAPMVGLEQFGEALALAVIAPTLVPGSLRPLSLVWSGSSATD